MHVRKADFAGSWYPDTAAACEQEIRSYLRQTEPVSGAPRVGGIVPHAGWYFSGAIACNVIHQLAREAAPDVYVVFGRHLHPHSPKFIVTEGAWETPFGTIPIHGELANALTDQFVFTVEDIRHTRPDNTIELQLPFIKYFSETATIVPIGVPPAAGSLKIGEAVVTAARHMGVGIKVIGSTDLTHYGQNYGFSPKGRGSDAVDWVRQENDRRVIDAMLAMDPEGVITEAMDHHNACCAGAAATALASAKALGAKTAETVAYTTSYDKSPGDSFVGYVGIVF